MTSLDDLLSALKNVVFAINGWSQTTLNINGTSNAAGLTTATVVKGSAGRLATVVVVATGGTAGKIYDGTNAALTANPLFTISATVGAYVVNVPFLYGLTVVPGAGQTITVSYS